MRQRPIPLVRLAAAGLVLAALAAPGCGRADRRQQGRMGRSLERLMDPERREVAVYQPMTEEGRTREVLTFDFKGIEIPPVPGGFTRLAHLPPVEQGLTGTCWCFTAVSFLESELIRLGRGKFKLSEIYPVYWEYVEKARRFVKQKGDSFLGQGSEPDSALERIKQHGIVREDDYGGLPAGVARHNHAELFAEFKAYLEGLKAKDDFDEARAVAGVRAILDRRLGRPPDAINVEGRPVSPRDFAANVLKLPLDDYVALMSFRYLPPYERGEFRVPDNWRRSAGYRNLPLHEFYLTLLRALRKGYTAALSADFTEPGYRADLHAAVVPTFDLPTPFIDASSREMRFAGGSTTDDHSVHAVGYREGDPHAWFLIKDSWETSWQTEPKGYMAFRDDYVRLKILMFVVHKDALPNDLTAKFK